MSESERALEASSSNLSFNGENIIVEKRWSGVINDDGENEDGLLGVTLTNAEGGEEYSTIDIEQVSEKDRQLAVEGAAFEWITGHIDDAGGQRIGISMIKFVSTESPAPYVPSEDELHKARQVGREMSKRLLEGQDETHTF